MWALIHQEREEDMLIHPLITIQAMIWALKIKTTIAQKFTISLMMIIMISHPKETIKLADTEVQIGNKD